MSFRDMVTADNRNVFSNTSEFAEPRDILYDDERYEAVPCTISQLKAKDRVIPTKDHAQGLYMVTSIIHFPIDAISIIPEKGSKIGIGDETGFMKYYYVAQSGCDMGMVRLELEAYDE